MTKRFLSLILALTMVVSMFAGIAITASAAGEQTLTFDLKANPGLWPTANSTTTTNYTYTLNSVDYTFALNNVKCNDSYLMLTKVAALGLPAISGYKLTKVVATNSGGCSTSVKVGISSSDSTASYIPGGEVQTWAKKSTAYTYNLTDTAENTMYYLYVTNKNGQIVSLDLTYAPVGTTPSCEHANTEARPEVPATCTENGYTAGTFCNDCQTYISGHEAIPALGHVWNEGEVTKAATCTEAGVKTFTCTRCNATKDEPIPALGHNFGEDGVCTNGCGTTMISAGVTTLSDGAQVIIYNKKNNMALSTAASATTGYLTGVAAAADTTDSVLKISGDVSVFTVHVVEGGYKFSVGDQYLTYGDKRTTLSMAADSDHAIWTLDTANHLVTVNSAYTFNNAPAVLYLNAYTGRGFTCYSTATIDEAFVMAFYSTNATICEHTYAETARTEATCTVAGSVTLTCSKCGDVKTEPIAALGHAFGEYTVTKEATCTEAGEKTRTCSRCNAVDTVVIPALGHADADQDGKCDRCGAEVELNLYTLTDTLTVGNEYVLVAKDADGKYWALSNFETGSAVTTCTEVTVLNNAVNNPDATVIFKAVSATDGICLEGGKEGYNLHLNSSKIRVATGFQNGLFTVAAGTETGAVSLKSSNDKYLTFANGSFAVSNEAADVYLFTKAGAHVHTLTLVDAKEATCTATGNEAYWTCTCGKLFADAEGVTELTEIPTTPALGHDFALATSGENYVAPTCTASGLAYEVCSRCGELGEGKEIPALGHDLHSTVFPATCTEEGYTHVTCSRCDYSDMTDIVEAKGHDFSVAPEKTDADHYMAPTCTEEGLQYNKCSRCDTWDTKGIVLPATGHGNYQYADNGDGTHKVTCGICSTVTNASEAHTFVDGTCACGAKETADPLLDKELGFYRVTLSLESYIGADFIVRVKNLTSYSDFYVVFEYPTSTGTTSEEVPLAKLTSSLSYATHKVAAKEMTDVIKATLYAKGADGKTYHGETVEWSVRSAMQEKLNAITDYTAKRSEVALCAAILNYGAAAQNRFSYKTEDLANNILTPEQLACLNTPSAAVNDQAEVPNGTGVTFSRMALSADSTICVNIAVKLGSYTADQVECRITYPTSSGSKTVSYTGQDITKLTSTTSAVVFELMAAKQLREKFTVTFYEAGTDNAISPTMTYSMQSYIATSTSTNQAQVALLNAVLAYGDAAADYFKN